MSTTWDRVIRENRNEILRRWQEGVLDLFSEKIAPGSPIGAALADDMGMILDGFALGSERCSDGLERVARILAVHPILPSRSMSMFIHLKAILLSVAPDGVDSEACSSRIETLTLEAFDSFMAHREKIYQLKVEETLGRMHMLQRSVQS